MPPRAATAFILLMAGIAAAEVLPPHCGVIGAERFPAGPMEPIPAVVLERGVILTVATTSDAVNGDTSTAAALVASPGADGISLREALTVTNRQPGMYTIRFAAALRGATLVVASNLPVLEAGNVIVSGDTDGDGTADVTLQAGGDLPGLQIDSSGNVLHALELRGFNGAVLFPIRSIGKVHASNAVLNLRIPDGSIGLLTGLLNGAAQTNNTWSDTLIAGNDVGLDIAFYLTFTAGNRVERLKVLRNTIRLKPGSHAGVGLGAGFLATGRGNTISDVLVSDNLITGSPDIGVAVTAGDVGSSGNLVENIRVERNRILLEPVAAPDNQTSSLKGIYVSNGDGATDYFDRDIRPVEYPENNLIRNVRIENNQIVNAAMTGLFVAGGFLGARNNRIEQIVIRGNTITGVGAVELPIHGVQIAAGSHSSFVELLPSTANVIHSLTLEGNTIQLTPLRPWEMAAAVTVIGGNTTGPGNRVEDVHVTHNQLDAGSVPSLQLLGGLGPSQGNSIERIEASCNDIATVSAYPELRAIHVAGGMIQATNNSATGITLRDNLVAGVLDDITVRPNSGSGTSGNTAEVVGVNFVPAVFPGGTVNAASFGAERFSAGMIASVFGENLARQTEAAGGAPLPFELGGATVRVDGVAAPLFFASPGQINFQIPWEAASRSRGYVTVTVDRVTGEPGFITLDPSAPGIFIVNGQGAIVNLQGVLVQGANAARAGDVIQIYATGFGAVTNTPGSGQAAPALPLAQAELAVQVRIGMQFATVLYAGLAPGFVGLYQVNAQLPANPQVGDAVPVELRVNGALANVVPIAIR